MVAECDYCGRSLDGLPHKCKFCGETHCSKHLLPESHKCVGLKVHKDKNAEKWKSTIASLTSRSSRHKEDEIKTIYPDPELVPPIKRRADTEKRISKSIFPQVLAWLNHREHRSYDYSRIFTVFLWKIIVFAISLGFVIFGIINLDSLNQLLIWFIPLGWIILAVAGFFALKSLFVFVMEFPNWLKRQPRWAKLLLVLVIAIYLWYVYQSKDWTLGYFGQESWKSKLSTSDLALSSEVLKLVNSFREENGVSMLEINDNAAKAGIFLTTEDVPRQLNSDLKSEVIIDYKLGENAIFFSGDLNEIQGYDINYRVNRWKSISRDNLLNTSFSSGAAICQHSFCYLILSSELPTVGKEGSTSLSVSKFLSSFNSSKNLPDISEKISETFSVEKDYSNYKTGEKNVNLGYFSFPVYQGLNDHLAGLPRSISYYYTPPTTQDFILRDLDNNVQKEFLMPLVEEIKNRNPNNKKAQADMAIAIVQGIPYDWGSFYAVSPDGRYPYEVLYDNTGVCGEKSELLAFLLRELGFGVVVFEFEAENHRAVGIKCSSGNYNTNYCFIESTDYYPVGQIPYEYVGGADIRNANPEVVHISEGMSYN